MFSKNMGLGIALATACLMPEMAQAEMSLQADFTYEKDPAANGLAENIALGGLGNSGRLGLNFDDDDDDHYSRVFMGWGQLGGYALSEAPENISLQGTDIEFGYMRFNEAFDFLGGQTYWGIDLRSEISSVMTESGETKISGDFTVMPAARWSRSFGHHLSVDIQGSMSAIAFSVNPPDDEATQNGERRVLVAIGDVAIPTEFVRTEVYSQVAYHFHNDWSLGLWRVSGVDALRGNTEAEHWVSRGLSLQTNW